MVTRFQFLYRLPFRRYNGPDDCDSVIIVSTTPEAAKEKWNELVKFKRWENQYGDRVELIDYSPLNNTEHATR